MRKMRKQGFYFFLSLVLFLSIAITANAQELNEAYWTDASGNILNKLDLTTGQSQVIRLKAEIPDAKTLRAYSLVMGYDSSKLEVLSAVKDPEGLFLSSMINDNVPGTIETNGFDISGIEGAGVLSLIELTVKSLSDTPCGIGVEFTAFGAASTDSFIPSVESLNINTNIIDGWVNIEGKVLYGETPLCTMVLANGEHMFTCDENNGYYKLFVPLDEKGQITLYCFCDGRAPFKATLEPWEAVYFDIHMVDASPYAQHMTVTAQTSSGIKNPEWTRITGTVQLGDTPLCTMILANGESMFTCGDSNGKYDLEVPLDSNGQITLFGFCEGLQPYKVTLTP